ncbi:MAG: PAS domain-containing sensor histidine kinase, partial [Flavobacteriales bacterium]
MSNETPITTRALDQMVYHAVMEFAPWPMAEVEGKTHVVQAVNRSFCTLMEKTEAELLGKPIAQLFAEGHATHGLLDSVRISGEAATHVETANNTPGPVYWSYTCWPLQAKDAPHVGLMIQVSETSKVDQQTKDMNEALLISAVEQHEIADLADRLNVRLHDEMLVRKELNDALAESEEFNRSITDSSPDCIKILDLDGNLLSMAERGQRLLCIPDITPYLNTPWSDFYQGEEDQAAAAAAIKKAAGGGEGKFIGFFTTLDGGPKWWDVRISPILDASGKPMKLLAVSRDITERRLAELALEQTAKDLAEADRHKSEFLATLAHELRNPLAPLRNGLELLTMVIDDRAAWDQAHGMMTRQLDQMVRLIDELMDLSRITRGAVDLRMEPVDLGTILEQALETSRSVLERQDHTLVRQLCEEPLIVLGDGMRLAQVFSNLLNNAAKYTDRGGVITVR